MSIEEEPSRAPSPSNGPGEGTHRRFGDSGDERRGPRRGPRRENGPASGESSGNGGGEDYKPSESSAARREPSSFSGERPRSGGGRRPERDDRRSGGSGGGGGGGGRSGGRREGSRGDDSRPKRDASPAPAPVAKAETGQSFLEELGGTLLASVSRSFSLTIKALPAELREPISAGYLLARALDTVADTDVVPVEKRLDHLRALLEMIKCGPDPELMGPLQKDLAAKQTDDGEKELIKKLPRCLGWLDALPAPDQWDLRCALFRIGRGQELDLLRFKDGTAALPKALASETELDEYTYFVAGCVGELWTKLCVRHLPAGWSRLPTDEMLKLGKRFGQGLQMTNILRDLPADLAMGRCYVPETMLSAQGLDTASLQGEPARARPILKELREATVAKLDDAWKYARAVTPLKLRYACALPVLLGFETLGLLAKTSPLETEDRLKISKNGMRGLMVSAAVGTALAAWHDSQYRRVRARALGK